jgi:hypothetical protein
MTVTTLDYLKAAQVLIAGGEESDGCTVLFSSLVHKYLSNSALICAAHDFGSRGIINGVSPGFHNNVLFFRANWGSRHYIWSVLSFVLTLPYAVIRYNIGLRIGVTVFHATACILIVAVGFWLYL